MASTLIPSISLSDLKRLSSSELKELKSVEVTVDGEYLFTAIVPATDYVKTQAEYLGVKSNSIGGKDLQEILERKNAPL